VVLLSFLSRQKITEEKFSVKISGSLEIRFARRDLELQAWPRKGRRCCELREREEW